MTQLSSVRGDASPAARRLLGRCAVGALRVTACRPIARPARRTTLVSRPLAVRLLGRSASGHRAASACRPVARSTRLAAVPRPLPVWSPSRCASRHGPEVQAVDRSPVHTSEPATVLEDPPVAAVSRRFRRPGVSPGPVPALGDVGDFYARDRKPHKGFAGGISTDFWIHRMIHSWGPVVPGPSTAFPPVIHRCVHNRSSTCPPCGMACWAGTRRSARTARSPDRDSWRPRARSPPHAVEPGSRR